MSDEDRNVEIRVDKIPIRGGIGAVLAIVLLLGALVLELPALRVPALGSILGGVVFGLFLIVWHKRRP
jgi:hypothetical protein